MDPRSPTAYGSLTRSSSWPYLMPTAAKIPPRVEHPSLWKCPRCGHRFVTRNLWHSRVRVRLGRAALESFMREAYR
jgi:hypothetical protein